MPKCFSKSLLTIVLVVVYLFIFDFVWLLLPDTSSTILLIGTLVILFTSFKLATMTADKIFHFIRVP